MDYVEISGTPVDQNVTAPSTVRFTINDDAVTLERDEEYPLTIAPYDRAVIVTQRMTDIIITDNVDSKCTSSLHIIVHYQERMIKWEENVRLLPILDQAE